jgi:hypothetical protein
MFFKNNQTKEKIISILSKNWPLSITELRSVYSFNNSYQYTRQCITELQESKIIVKRGRKYKLSVEWLEKVNAFSRKSIDNYKFGTKNNILTMDTTQIQVNSLEELGNFMLEALEGRFLEKKDKRGFFCQVGHLWIPFLNRNKQKRLASIKDKVNVVYTKNDLLDKLLYKMSYKKFVESIKFENKNIDYIFFVYNHTVFQIYFPHELHTLMDTLYSGKVDFFKKSAQLFAMTYKEFPINIIIVRNKVVAQKHREVVTNFFNH